MRLTLTASPSAAIICGVLVIAIVIGSTLANWSAGTPIKTVTLVYVGAENCAPCDIWQRSEGTAFRHSAEFRRLTYREVKSPSLFEVLKDENWPEDLRAYRQTISERMGVPLWLVIADGQLAMQSSGLTQWQKVILPKIKSLLERS